MLWVILKQQGICKSEWLMKILTVFQFLNFLPCISIIISQEVLVQKLSGWMYLFN